MPTQNNRERGRLLSICVPAFNEAANIAPLYERVRAAMAMLPASYDFELLFIDDHSEDGTFERISEIAGRDRRVRALRFSRNFGFQRAVLTAYTNARGDAAVQLDCDLQDPPELIREFVKYWEQGYDVVYGIRRSRGSEAKAMQFTRRCFYWLIDFLSEDRLPHDAGDFRLIDRRILDELKKVRDQQPYLRGMIAAMGFRQIGIPYDRSDRVAGRSKFRLGALVALGLDGILHHSVVPLRLATIFGVVMSGVAAFGALYYLIAHFFRTDWPVGLASSSIIALFSVGMNALLLGIIGEYVGRIYKNVKAMPFVIIESCIDHAATGSSEQASQ